MTTSKRLVIKGEKNLINGIGMKIRTVGHNHIEKNQYEVYP